MKTRRAVLLLLILIPLLILAAYGMKDVVRVYILAPLWYLWRIASILQSAVPQVLCWGLFLVLLAWVAARSLFQKHRVQVSKKTAEDESLSRAQTWTRWIDLPKRKGANYSRWRLTRQATQLALEVIAYQERLTLEQASAAVQAGKLDIPPELRAVMQVGLETPSFRHYSDLQKRLRSFGGVALLQPDLQVIAQYLEKSMHSGG